MPVLFEDSYARISIQYQDHGATFIVPVYICLIGHMYKDSEE